MFNPAHGGSLSTTIRGFIILLFNVTNLPNAFELSISMMKPCSVRNMDEESRIFNYQLSRVRRASENAFEISGFLA